MRIVKFWQRLRGSEQIMVAAAAGLVLFLLWASIERVDEVSRGQGRVIPSSKVQIIQSSEPSTTRQILVPSGQTVQKGQLGRKSGVWGQSGEVRVNIGGSRT